MPDLNTRLLLVSEREKNPSNVSSTISLWRQTMSFVLAHRKVGDSKQEANTDPSIGWAVWSFAIIYLSAVLILNT